MTLPDHSSGERFYRHGPFLACESTRHIRTDFVILCVGFESRMSPRSQVLGLFHLSLPLTCKLIENLGVLASSSLVSDAASAVSPQAQFTRNLLIRSMLPTRKVFCPVLYR